MTRAGFRLGLNPSPVRDRVRIRASVQVGGMHVRYVWPAGRYCTKDRDTEPEACRASYLFAADSLSHV